MSRVDDALLLRDTIQRIVDDKLGKERPKSSYALVTGFNPDEGTVSVIFDGDDITVDIPAGSIYPSEIGQTVRVGGGSGAKVIEDVMGENLTEVKARTAQETADGKNTVNYGETPPEGTDHKDGDIWFDEGNSNMPHVWKDGNWVSIEDLRVAAIAEAQDELRQDLDTVVENGVGTKSFYKPTEPTAAESKEGDLWFDTSAGGNNELHTYVNGAWVSAADARIAAIQQAQAELASDLEDVVANGIGTRTHYTPTKPAVADSKEGDLWFDTSTAGKNALHVFTGGAWVSAADARLAELKDAQAEMTGDITAAQQKADEAFQNAADADSKAVTAQAKADLANDRAQAILRASNSIVPNGDFEDNSPNIWPNTTYQSGISVVEADHARSGTHVMRVDSTSANRYPLTDWRSSGEGRIYYAEVWVYHNDTDMTQRGRVSFYANSEFKDGSTVGYTGKDLDGKYVYAYQDEMTPGVWNKVSAYLTAPEGTVNIRVAPHVIKNETPFDFDDFKVIDVTESIAALREANQAKADADTAKSAADAAQSAADAAQSAASNAQSTATEALTSANSKNTVTRSTANPTTPYTGRVDDIWWKMSTLSSGGRVIAQYRWNGTAWLTETIDNAVIANLDAAKITTGYLAAARIKANTLNADTVLINGSLGSIILRDGAITTPKIAVGAITAESGVVASLDAGKITVGTLDVARLGANSITADKVLLGAGGNLIPSPDFKTGWSGSYPVSTSGGVSDSPFMTITEGSGQRGAYLGLSDLPHRQIVEPGAMYRVRAWVRSPSEIAPGNAAIFVRAYTPTGSEYAWSSPNGASNTSTIPANTWTIVEGLVTMPADRSRAVMGVYKQSAHGTASMDWCLPSLTAVAGSTLIEPGAITTEKIATGAITAQSGIIASLDAGKITVGTIAAARFAANTINADSILVNGSLGSTIIKDGAITTKKLATGAITAESGVIGSLDASKITVGKLSGARLEADAINGMQIIGATIATSTGFPRVQLDTAGIAVYKSSTVRSFFADAKTGNLDLVGNLATATSGNERVVLDNALWNSIEVVDEEGNLAGSVAGSGISVGIGGQATLDLFHAGRSIASSGSYVDSGSIMGPRPTGQTRGAILSLSRTIRTDNSEFNWASLDVGKANGYYTARVGVTDADGSAFINANGPVRVTSERFFSVSTTGRGARMYIKENSDLATNYLSGLYVETNAREPVVINKIERPGYSERTSLSLQYNGDVLASLMATKGYHANVSSSGDTLGIILNGMVTSADGSKLTVNHDGQAELHGSDIRPLTIKYNGTGASWLIPFKKGNTEWGYIGSTGAMGVDDFGIQSGSGKRLVLNAGTGSAKIILDTDGSIQGLPIATGDGVDFPTVAANGGSQTVTIKFPSGKFNVAPSVSAMTSHGRVTPVVFNITKTGFSFRVWNFTSSTAPSVVGSWMAVAAS